MRSRPQVAPSRCVDHDLVTLDEIHPLVSWRAPPHPARRIALQRVSVDLSHLDAEGAAVLGGHGPARPESPEMMKRHGVGGGRPASRRPTGSRWPATMRDGGNALGSSGDGAVGHHRRPEALTWTISSSSAAPQSMRGRRSPSYAVRRDASETSTREFRARSLTPSHLYKKDHGKGLARSDGGRPAACRAVLISLSPHPTSAVRIKSGGSLVPAAQFIEGRHAARCDAGPAGAKGSSLVSMCQMEVVSSRASSTRATDGPR
jgi:hypothetical protein